MSDLIERLNDLASREATTMPPGWSDAYTLYKDAAAALAAKDAEIARLRDALAGLRSIVRVARSPDAPINMRQFRAAIDRADAELTGKENGE